MRLVLYNGFQKSFVPDRWILHSLLVKSGKRVGKIGPCFVLGPFKKKTILTLVAFVLVNKYDFFITGENKPPLFRQARKQIGFWRSYSGRDDVFRFPNWMWHLDWPEIEDQPPYPRYGMRLSIDRLMQPISETYHAEQLRSRQNRASLFSRHLREPRRRLFHLTDSAVGCDGFGLAFGSNDRDQPKMQIMERYRFSLCPENSIGDGYITEKIPEAFHSGCIPITWCRPEDLAEDFNSEAVVNLYGLDDHQCYDLLEELDRCGNYYRDLLSVPLLKNRPRLSHLIDFLNQE